ncbi:MAG TPA: FAD-linked oxidase C-terminal domain-containing protein, partial [Polyangia bacterium]|nr:FAD-linked oxidase C-terminal domain-containing protein [Polyangia bacterium]
MKQRTSQSALPPGPIGPTGTAAASGDAAVAQRRTLLGELRALFPPERLIVDSENLFVYECDAQTTDRGTPLAIVFPESAAEVSAVVKACARRQVSFVPRGAGTGLSGGAVATGSVVISLVRMNQIHEIDAANRQAWVGPGVVNAHLSRAVASLGLHYAPDPSSQNACTIGGNVAENSGGPHTLKYGVTTNHILALEVVLPDGEVAMLGGAAEGAPGYDLVSAFVGSEGTFGLATKILVRLTPNPEGVKTALAIFDTVTDASRAVTEILARGITPAAIEMIDQVTLRAVEAYIHAGFPLDAAAVLLVEVDGFLDDLDEQARRVVDACRAMRARDVRLARDEAERLKLWKGRKQAFGALGRVAPNYYTHDGVIPRSRLPEVLDEIVRTAAAHGVLCANVFHAGDGNLHPVILFDEREPGVIDRVRAAGDAILRLVVRVGGALSGEHGIGCEKIDYMGLIYSEADLAAFRRLRAVFNPAGLCNPDKVIPGPGRCVELGPGGHARP